MAKSTKIFGLLFVLLSILCFFTSYYTFSIIFIILGFLSMFLHKSSHKNIISINDEGLAKYLSQFHCDKCRNHCRLDQVKCSRGQALQQEKTKEYNSK